ncbi:hypothetical protein [Parasitella parasitica]|uniref:Uncharacterized protein n=1 Tax=Parasitella parasitica TaxID=35722 RepID=A0A0B7NPL9_9FUNG|nr:hypothetical protein [Parasitella parasitica]
MLNTTLVTNGFALHRKSKLSSKLNKFKSDQRLVATLRARFPGATFVMGDYSAPNVRFQEPIRDKGFRRLLKKSGFPVFLIDEN